MQDLKILHAYLKDFDKLHYCGKTVKDEMTYFQLKIFLETSLCSDNKIWPMEEI